MKTTILLVALLSVRLCYSQDWPANSDYVYFGSSTLTQSLPENYALLQSKYTGETYLNSPDRVYLRINNSTKFIISNNGNVGIGTTSPSEKLHISGSGIVKSLVESSDNHAYFSVEGAASKGSFVDYHRKGDGRIWHTGLRDANNNFEFRLSNQSTVLTLKDNGYVGVGTSNPFQKLSLVDGQVFIGNSSVNQVESGRLRFSEYTNSFQGAFIHYNGSSNILNIGVHGANDTNTSNDYNSISIRRDNGNVGIGTTTTGSHKLAVEGSIGAREIKVEASGWSDFVFKKDYELRTLEEVEEHIEENGHLPEIPSGAEVTENGINLGEMNAKLLQKIEELTLYLIEQNKQNQAQQERIEKLEEKITQLEGK